VTYFVESIQQAVSELGGKVANARAERGWSLQQLADRSVLSPAAIHKIEKSGMTPTIASLMKIAAALGRSVSFFVEESASQDVNVIRGDDRAKVYTSKRGLASDGGKVWPHWSQNVASSLLKKTPPSSGFVFDLQD